MQLMPPLRLRTRFVTLYSDALDTYRREPRFQETIVSRRMSLLLKMNLALLQLATAVTLCAVAAHTPPPLAVQTDNEYSVLADVRLVKVPVVLGVMSACPDAIFCEAVFDDVLAQVGDKVDLSLTFIGKCVSRLCQLN